MKYKLFQILMVMMLSIILISCNNNAPNLDGEWTGTKGHSLMFIKDGDNYNIKCYGWGGIQYLNGKYDNGTIKVGQGMVGDIMYSIESDKIYFDGKEFSRKNVDK